MLDNLGADSFTKLIFNSGSKKKLLFPEYIVEAHPAGAKFFSACILSGRLHHGFILVGGQLSSQQSLLRELGMLLNCTARSPNAQACRKCRNCTWIFSGEHPECPIEIQPDLEKSKKGVIVVDQIKELMTRLRVAFDGERIVWFQQSDLDELPPQSSNLLLKIVEEPPKKTRFVFSATDDDNVLATIKSRCQIVNLPYTPRVSAEQSAHLEPVIDLLKHPNPSLRLKLLSQIGDDVGKLQDLLTALIDRCAELNPEIAGRLLVGVCEAKRRLAAFCRPRFVLQELLCQLVR